MAFSPEQTLVLLKPDAVRRALAGEIIARIERAGLAIVAAKLVKVDRDFAAKHYTWEDIGARHGKDVWERLLKFLSSDPVFALVVEGVSAVANMRRLSGATEPMSAAPGTIRGDYSHHSFSRAGEANQAIRNLIHASATAEEAKSEIALWFRPEEIVSYRRDDATEHDFQ